MTTTSSSSRPATESGSGVLPSGRQAWLLGGGFFLAMLLHELVLEAVQRRFESLGLVLASCVTLAQFTGCAVCPFVVGTTSTATQPWPKTVRSLALYIALSLLVWGSTALATASLLWVSYPTKVVVKSAKLIPTMLVATTCHGTRFSKSELLAALFLCLGTAGFAYDPARASGGTTHVGLGLLLASISCDSVVPNLMQRIMTVNTISSPQLMVNVNACGLVGVLASIFVAGQGTAVVHACVDAPSLLAYLATVGATLSVSVYLYTTLIRESGGVVAVAVATVRKVFTVVLSYLVFPKPVTSVHVVAGISVVGGVVLNTVAKHKQPLR